MYQLHSTSAVTGILHLAQYVILNYLESVAHGSVKTSGCPQSCFAPFHEVRMFLPQLLAGIGFDLLSYPARAQLGRILHEKMDVVRRDRKPQNLDVKVPANPSDDIVTVLSYPADKDLAPKFGGKDQMIGQHAGCMPLPHLFRFHGLC
jgi:hypothetical protein